MPDAPCTITGNHADRPHGEACHLSLLKGNHLVFEAQVTVTEYIPFSISVLFIGVTVFGCKRNVVEIPQGCKTMIPVA